ncbi:MAG: protein kinase [Verrucomicrobia bacterium]|nr:protein kinase [Verrucomicrobiota bacterium]
MNTASNPEEALFEAARRLVDPDQRHAFLDAACGGQVELRRRLDELLAVLPEAEAYFGRPAAGTFARVSEGAAPAPDSGGSGDEAPGTMIGRYKLLQKVGEGGFGAVYVAEQQEPVRRLVALKTIKLGMDTRQVVARFEAERQALALMEHPNIAKVLEAGATEAGRPYFVMELVRGVPITHYCKQHQLSTVECLVLFLQVCHAIQHAHQKGVIHRDLKPSNILVTRPDSAAAAGVPKVIDFGIAKATQGELTDEALYTRLHQLVGTPAYMSPEQAAMGGLDIDTRSDIYSLGVLLYELLAGTTPFDSKVLMESGLDEMRRIIREQEPVRPSTRLAQEQVAGPRPSEEKACLARARRPQSSERIRLVRGDLDWIVMKCLEKDRSRRYETADALAADLEHHLRHEPVVARPPSAVYRARKFIRRNQVIVGAGVAVAVVLLLGICVSAWQAHQQGKLRAEAEQARDNEAAARLTAEQQQYVASIALAQNLIEQGQYDHARQRLAWPGLESLHGWEWGWLQRACHRDLLTFDGGGTELTGAAFSPDGRWLAVGGFDGRVRLWDLNTGRLVHQLEGHTQRVLLLDFSPLPDDGRLVTAGFDGTARIWDAGTGQELIRLEGHDDDWVYCAVFSPDGETVATGGRDKTVRLWNAQTGAPLEILEHDYGDSVMCVAFSPDGRKLAYAGGSGDPYVRRLDTPVRVLDLTTRERRDFTGHSNSVPCVVFSPDGDRIATAGWDGTARLAKVATDTELRPFFVGRRPGGWFSVAFSPDNRRCAVGGAMADPRSLAFTASVHVIDLETGLPVQVYEGHSRLVRVVKFSPDGSRIATTSWDGTAKVWPVSAPPEFLSLEGHDQAVWTLAVSPNGRWLATGSLDQTARIWEIETGRLVCTLPVNSPVVSLAFDADGSRLVTVGPGATASVWAIRSDEGTGDQTAIPAAQVLTLSGHTQPVLCVACDPRGRWIATGSKDHTARIWDARSGHSRLTLDGHAGWVVAVAFNPDGTRVATASADCTAKVWDAETGRLLFTLKGHDDWVLDVIWSPDNQLIATGSQDRTARLWDAAAGRRLLGPLGGHTDGVSSLAFSPDSRRLATAEGGTETQRQYDRLFAVGLWDVATGENLLRFKAHNNVVRAVRFSPDGTRLITGSVDHTARVRHAFDWTIPDRDFERYKAWYWSQVLARGAAQVQGVSKAERRMERGTLGEFNLPESGRTKTRPLLPIPARDPNAGPDQIDLAGVYNAALTETWKPITGLTELGDDLSFVSVGMQLFEGVGFDPRGVIQLCRSDPDWFQFPSQVEIPLDRHLRRLHVLHGTVSVEREGAIIGAYQLHYADGEAQELEIRYGLDVRDWQSARDPRPVAAGHPVAWTPATGAMVRLFTTVYANPRPHVRVRRIDFISRNTGSAPFLVAMTAEP